MYKFNNAIVDKIFLIYIESGVFKKNYFLQEHLMQVKYKPKRIKYGISCSS